MGSSLNFAANIKGIWLYKEGPMVSWGIEVINSLKIALIFEAKLRDDP